MGRGAYNRFGGNRTKYQKPRGDKQVTGKPYTGEQYQQVKGNTKGDIEEIKPFPSDHECLCLVEVEDGSRQPDPFCDECKGSGKARFFSLYEVSIKESK